MAHVVRVDPQTISKGDAVATWYDCGGGRNGASVLHGTVTAAGAIAIVITWESGLRNRIRRADFNAMGLWLRNPDTEE